MTWLAERIAAARPATGDIPGALESATAETWTSRSAKWPIWSGRGTALLTAPPPPNAVVVGLTVRSRGVRHGGTD
jgi:hypothetical protein